MLKSLGTAKKCEVADPLKSVVMGGCQVIRIEQVYQEYTKGVKHGKKHNENSLKSV